MELTRLRNTSIIAHIDHGKSTLADRMLEICGAVDPREMRSQYLDSMDIERERGITIKAQSVTLNYTANDGETYQLNFMEKKDLGYKIYINFGGSNKLCFKLCSRYDWRRNFYSKITKL